MRELVETAVRQGCGELCAGPFDRVVPEGVELFRSVAGGGHELPVVAAVPAERVPRRTKRLAAQLDAESVVLLYGEMLEQAAEGERGTADAGLQPGSVKAVGLEAEGRTQSLERTDDMLDLATGERRFPGRRFPTDLIVRHAATVEPIPDTPLPESKARSRDGSGT